MKRDSECAAHAVRARAPALPVIGRPLIKLTHYQFLAWLCAKEIGRLSMSDNQQAFALWIANDLKTQTTMPERFDLRQDLERRLLR